VFPTGLLNFHTERTANMPRNVQLLLTESVDSLGIVGDVVNVRLGYARNFLLPGRWPRSRRKRRSRPSARSVPRRSASSRAAGQAGGAGQEARGDRAVAGPLVQRPGDSVRCGDAAGDLQGAARQGVRGAAARRASSSRDQARGHVRDPHQVRVGPGGGDQAARPAGPQAGARGPGAAAPAPLRRLPQPLRHPARKPARRRRARRTRARRPRPLPAERRRARSPRSPRRNKHSAFRERRNMRPGPHAARFFHGPRRSSRELMTHACRSAWLSCTSSLMLRCERLVRERRGAESAERRRAECDATGSSQRRRLQQRRGHQSAGVLRLPHRLLHRLRINRVPIARSVAPRARLCAGAFSCHRMTPATTSTIPWAPILAVSYGSLAVSTATWDAMSKESDELPHGGAPAEGAGGDGEQERVQEQACAAGHDRFSFRGVPGAESRTYARGGGACRWSIGAKTPWRAETGCSPAYPHRRASIAAGPR